MNIFDKEKIKTEYEWAIKDVKVSLFQLAIPRGFLACLLGWGIVMVLFGVFFVWITLKSCQSQSYVMDIIFLHFYIFADMCITAGITVPNS